MFEINWDLLGETNLKVAWRLIAELLSRNCFPGMTPVPKMEEACNFDLMVCFTEDASEEKLQLHGHIADIARIYEADGHPNTNMAELLYICSHLTKEELEITSNRSHWQEKDKSILVEMSGLIKQIVDFSSVSEGSLVIDKTINGLEDVKNIFIISEVIYASYIKVEVDVDGFTLSDEINKIVPVAFSYKKFQVDEIGVLKSATSDDDDFDLNFFPGSQPTDISLDLKHGGEVDPVCEGTRSNKV